MERLDETLHSPELGIDAWRRQTSSCVTLIFGEAPRFSYERGQATDTTRVLCKRGRHPTRHPAIGEINVKTASYALQQTVLVWRFVACSSLMGSRQFSHSSPADRSNLLAFQGGDSDTHGCPRILLSSYVRRGEAWMPQHLPAKNGTRELTAHATTIISKITQVRHKRQSGKPQVGCCGDRCCPYTLHLYG